MIKILPKVLDVEQVRHIHQLLEQGEFVDGKLTAGWHAKDVKQNLQWQAHSEMMNTLNHFISERLANDTLFTTTTYPKYLAPFIVSKSLNNGYYGRHVDDALLAGDGISRSDISCTIFLSDAKDYQGGELCFDYHGLDLKYKLDAGDVIIYPSTTVHEVRPVTQGCRTVAVSWIESYIRDASKREVLYDLDQSRQQVLSQLGKGETFDLLAKSHANLLRRWAQT